MHGGPGQIIPVDLGFRDLPRPARTPTIRGALHRTRERNRRGAGRSQPHPHELEHGGYTGKMACVAIVRTARRRHPGRIR